MTHSSYPDFRGAFVKRHRARQYYATCPATQKSENQTYHPTDTDTDDALAAVAGAGAAGVLRPVVAVAAMHRIIGDGRRGSRTVVCQPDGAVQARVAQRRPVVAGAQGEGEGGQGPGALRGDDKQRQGPGQILPAGGKKGRGDDGPGRATEADGPVPVVGDVRQLRRVCAEQRVHVLHVQQFFVRAVAGEERRRHGAQRKGSGR